MKLSVAPESANTSHLAVVCADLNSTGIHMDQYLLLYMLIFNKAEHESRLLTGTHGLTRENTHHEPDPWIWIYSQWQIPKDPGLTFGEQNTHEYPPWVPLLTSQFKGNIWCKLLKLAMYWPG